MKGGTNLWGWRSIPDRIRPKTSKAYQPTLPFSLIRLGRNPSFGLSEGGCFLPFLSSQRYPSKRSSARLFLAFRVSFPWSVGPFLNRIVSALPAARRAVEVVDSVQSAKRQEPFPLSNSCLFFRKILMCFCFLAFVTIFWVLRAVHSWLQVQVFYEGSILGKYTRGWSHTRKKRTSSGP